MPSSPTDNGGSVEHATCVAIGGRGVLIAGPSGSGKSDLALRLIREDAKLVADDRTALSVSGGRLMASAPAPLRGLLEVRGLGVVRLYPSECAGETEVVGLVELAGDRAGISRMPQLAHKLILDRRLPVMSLFPFDESATAKVHMFLRTIDDLEMLIE